MKAETKNKYLSNVHGRAILTLLDHEVEAMT